MENASLLILLFITLCCLSYHLLIVRNSEAEMVRQRLKSIKKREASGIIEAEMNRPFSDRVIRPVMEGVGKALLRLAPIEMINNLERKIVMAGRPKGRGVKAWLGIQAFLTLGLPLIIILFFLWLKVELGSLIMLATATAIIGVLYPNMILNGKIRKRQTKVLKNLPDVMDLLTVSVEAGLTFDSALAKVVEKMPGTLAKEFETVLREIKVGKSKKEALYGMSDRIGLQDLRSFSGAVVQADQLGVRLGRVLRIQSEQIRQNRKQQIQEKAMKAPIKMLIPMVVFIFPPIFVVLLGPVIINMIRLFTGM